MEVLRYATLRCCLSGLSWAARKYGAIEIRRAELCCAISGRIGLKSRRSGELDGELGLAATPAYTNCLFPNSAASSAGLRGELNWLRLHRVKLRTSSEGSELGDDGPGLDYIGSARATQLLSPDYAGATEMLEGTKSHMLGQRSLIV